MKPAVNTIVHAAHAAAADDGLREASVVNIEMRGGRGQEVLGFSLQFLLFPIIYPMYGLHMCEDVCKYAQKMFLSLWDGSAASYLILCRPDIKKIVQAPISPALAQWRQKDLRRTSEGSQKDLRRTSEGPWVFPRNALCDKK